MKQFVLIFRQGPEQLSEADLKQRAVHVSTWAPEQNKAGRKLDPRILGKEGLRIGADGASGPVPASGDGPLTAILFLEAEDLSDAVKVAEGHPGVKYGASVEVRPWASPVPVQ